MKNINLHKSHHINQKQNLAEGDVGHCKMPLVRQFRMDKPFGAATGKHGLDFFRTRCELHTRLSAFYRFIVRHARTRKNAECPAVLCPATLQCAGGVLPLFRFFSVFSCNALEYIQVFQQPFHAIQIG